MVLRRCVFGCAALGGVLAIAAVWFQREMSRPLYQFNAVQSLPLDPLSFETYRFPINSSNPTEATTIADDQLVGFWRVAPNISLFHHSVFVPTSSSSSSSSSKPTTRHVLVIHGGPGAPFVVGDDQSSPWSQFINEFKQQQQQQQQQNKNTAGFNFVFHFYHQRGCGLSTRPFPDRMPAENNWYKNMLLLEGSLGLTSQLADIERVRRIVVASHSSRSNGDDQKVVVVGFSFGGVLASLYAAEFPASVHSLILIAPAPMILVPFPGGDLLQIIRHRMASAVSGISSDEVKNQLAKYDAWFVKYLDYARLFEASEASLSQLQSEFASFFLQVYPSHLIRDIKYHSLNSELIGGWIAHAMYLSINRLADFRPHLLNYLGRVLVIHGSQDLGPVSHSQLYVDAFAARSSPGSGSGFYYF